MMQTKIIVFLFALFSTTMALNAQESVLGKYKDLSCPEKLWVIRHPFIAKKAWRITRKALETTKTITNEFPIDNDLKGGQLDAFKHTYWMALLSKSIACAKASKLGKAHEKGNYIAYKKGRTEDGAIPDQASFQMDAWNNNVGIYLGNQYKNLDEEELKKIVIEYLIKGEMKIIKKDNQGNYIDCSGELIPKESLEKWNNPKCVVSSNGRK